jgi:hypothetical protein
MLKIIVENKKSQMAMYAVKENTIITTIIEDLKIKSRLGQSIFLNSA